MWDLRHDEGGVVRRGHVGGVADEGSVVAEGEQTPGLGLAGAGDGAAEDVLIPRVARP